MRHLDSSDHRRRRATRRKRLTPLVAVREWWWNYDRRRHIAQMNERDVLHRLDEEEEDVIDALEEEYVIDALARQLEEIRNLPEIAY